LIRIDTENTPNYFVLIHDFGASMGNHTYAPDYAFDLKKLMDCILKSGLYEKQVYQGCSIIDGIESMDDIDSTIHQLQELFKPYDAPNLNLELLIIE
jgi:hypothetical protein